MHVFKHPKFYEELRKRAKEEQRIAEQRSAEQSSKPQASGSKQQAPSIKPKK